MQKISKNNQEGSITLIMVFFTATVLFLFVFADHVTAMKEKMISKNDATTEQAFYAAQSCLEEGYLQLRTNENYTGTSLSVGGADCTVVPQPDESQPTSGRLISQGEFHKKERKVASYYADAGASTTRNNSAIYHILDRSGSMDDDGSGCTISGYVVQTDCEAIGGIWGMQPITSAKEAAKSFIDHLDLDHDIIGVVSYSDTANLEFAASNLFDDAKQSIENIMYPYGVTNIGDAIALATTNLIGVSEENNRVEILLTDGIANTPADEPEEYALTKAEEAKADGIIIFTIGLGAGVNEDFLENVASNIDGNSMYFHAPSAGDLENIYDSIASVIISYNIRQDSWREE